MNLGKRNANEDDNEKRQEFGFGGLPTRTAVVDDRDVNERQEFGLGPVPTRTDTFGKKRQEFGFGGAVPTRTVGVDG